MQYVRERHPDVPVVYYANGGSSYLELQARVSTTAVGRWEIATRRAYRRAVAIVQTD